ncbi:MAG: oleate hydratase, partial [Ferruginibacter sp.]|nr:oleate hydratase [Ferruginibacter sp.]
MQKSKTAIIIGSGVAGLATAIRLQLKGYTVTVYEKNSYPGGKLSAFEKQGYHFDAGPSLFTQPQNIEELFTLANEPIEEYFTYQPVTISCKYFYENGKVLHAYANAADFANELQEQLGENADSIKKYLNNADKLYNNVGEVFLNHSLHKRKTWVNKKIVKALRSVKLSHLFKTLHGYNT